ncbi:hypothetical protein HJG54_00935 [Leptolyngbya sp. NK1-12]|uniref:Deoxyribonuclease NucA/NucB domain-containing protein n=1 Tax=Leptolyngbya sp. NK1-12 TaxID=2547451 RepID=A0AA97APG7_9CYAN|nr:hypothetical protein HJG54_00935 [Leptolyngbya sp. NK1-12]
MFHSDVPPFGSTSFASSEPPDWMNGVFLNPRLDSNVKIEKREINTSLSSPHRFEGELLSFPTSVNATAETRNSGSDSTKRLKPVFRRNLIRSEESGGVDALTGNKTATSLLNSTSNDSLLDHRSTKPRSFPAVEKQQRRTSARATIRQNVANPSSRSVPSSDPSPFDTTVITDRVRFKITEQPNEIFDGDRVVVIFNRRVIAGNLLLQPFPLGKTFSEPLRPGVNTLRIIALNTGAITEATPFVWFKPTIKAPRLQLNPGVNQLKQVLTGAPTYAPDLQIGQSDSFTIGLPQITVPISRYPESAAHILDRQGVAPDILTLDRALKGKDNPRRRQSIRNYKKDPSNPRTVGKQDYDEYPPAAFLENGGRANIRPIASSDNQGSGAFMQGQYNGKKYGYIPNGGKVVIRVVP